MHDRSMRMGELLLFCEELAIQRSLHHVDCADICLFGDPAYASATLTSMLNGISGIGSVSVARSEKEVSRIIETGSYVCYPHNFPALEERIYGLTRYVKRLLSPSQPIVQLSCKRHIRRWALDLLDTRANGKLPIALHLKNGPVHKKSNARFDVWHRFISSFVPSDEFVFVLIGNEPVDPMIAALPNVLIASDLGSEIAKDFAFIELSHIFMGAVSGPCNFTIFTDVPYLLYKDPDHSPEEMIEELGKNTAFPFAHPDQLVFRLIPDAEHLQNQFRRIDTPAHRETWRARIGKLHAGVL
jgi:hypothetical protein